MAFSNPEGFGIDKSDLHRWATSNEAKAFVKEIETLKRKSFSKLLKEGAKHHDKNAESYNAYESILKLLNEAVNGAVGK